ncbi:subtilisin-like protease SBT1.9 [Gossypium australe]|uniref:Subtilisin-like protease SBT1.9 n=1 Tax=Gossypium australe TaxID=47621 RepID=A0A5B6X5B0_9ROSI|nr:subtilisin-like protease SBT1.9 [Gossypium australe]
MASGDLVLAAWPPNVGVARLNEDFVFSNFNLISGTSMACPHVSEVETLLKVTYPDWSLAAIRLALMNTSNTIDNARSPIKDMGANLRPARPLAMGAVHINPNKGLHPGLMNFKELTHVGEGSSTYIATVTPIKGVKVTVEPDKLVFMAKNEKKNFKLSIERPSQTVEAVSFGHLTWEVIEGKHVVKSPIVATSYSLET